NCVERPHRFVLGASRERRPERVSDGTDLGDLPGTGAHRGSEPVPSEKAPERGRVREQLRVGLELVPGVHQVDREPDGIVVLLEHRPMLTSRDQSRLMILTTNPRAGRYDDEERPDACDTCPGAGSARPGCRSRPGC